VSFTPTLGLTRLKTCSFLEHRVKEEIGSNAKPYRAWWNGIAPEWKY
jgi:hypothetical protein